MHENRVRIDFSLDNSIAELINELNRQGYETIDSCSAMKKDHDNNLDKDPSCTGYFTFIASNKNCKRLVTLVTRLGFRVEYNFYLNPFKKYVGVYQPYRHWGTDNIKMQLWNKLLEELKLNN